MTDANLHLSILKKQKVILEFYLCLRQTIPFPFKRELLVSRKELYEYISLEICPPTQKNVRGVIAGERLQSIRYKIYFNQ